MADNISIPIGGDYIDVPRWATDENLRELVKIDENVLKSLTALLKDNKTYTNQTIRSNEKALDSIKNELKSNQKDDKKQQDQQTRSLKDLFSLQKFRNHIAKQNLEYSKNFDRNLENGFKNLNNNIKDMPGKIAKGLDTGKLADIATAIGSVAGLGAVAGAAVGVIEGFAKNLTVLSNNGVGLTVGLQDLRGDAARAGLNLENYGKIIQANGRAINALGSTTDEGARRFAALSDELRTNARQFGQFGLTNTEYNEILAEEIELRRRAGMSQDQITRSVNSSMNELMQETTALAAITGQDRRDMLRNRQSILSDPVIESARAQFAALGEDLPENIGNLGAIIGGMGEEGAVFAGALAQAAVTDIPFFSTALGQSLSEMIAVGGPEIQSAFGEIADFVDANALTMDPEQFNNEIVKLMSGLGDVMSGGVRESLMALSTTGNESATRLLAFTNQLQGFTGSQEEIDAARDGVEAGLRANEGLLGLASALEETANNISASAINTAFETLGVDIREAGSDLTGAIRGIGDQFGPDKGLIEGMFSGTFTGLLAALGILTVAVNGLAAVMGAGMIGGGLRNSFGRRGSRSRIGRLFGGREATRAPADVERSGQRGGRLGTMGRVGRGALRGGGIVGSLVGAATLIPLLADDEATTTEKSEGVGEVAGGAGGAAAGAIAGAAIGSIVPGVGTAIGGIVGSIIGGLGGSMLGGAVGEAIGEQIEESESRPEVDTEAVMQNALTNQRIHEVEQMIQQREARIARSEAGENEYWGSEESGRADSRSEIEELQQELESLRNSLQETSADPATSSATILGTHAALLAQSETDADAARRLQELESSDRYKVARARQLAREMGIENPDQVQFTTEANVPNVINGQRVDPELLTERERQNLSIARQTRELMNGNRPAPDETSSIQDPTTESAVQQAAASVPPGERPMTREQGDRLISALEENNRLVRRGNDAAEMNA